MIYIIIFLIAAAQATALYVLYRRVCKFEDLKNAVRHANLGITALFKCTKKLEERLEKLEVRRLHNSMPYDSAMYGRALRDLYERLEKLEGGK